MTSPPAPYETTERGSSAGKTFAIVLGAIVGTGALILLTCAGALLGVVKVGENLVEAEIQSELAEVLAPHAGEIRVFDVNWTESSRYPEPDVLVYDVEGSLGRGKVVTEHVTVDDGSEEVRWAVWHGDEAPPVAVYGEPPEKFLAVD